MEITAKRLAREESFFYRSLSSFLLIAALFFMVGCQSGKEASNTVGKKEKEELGTLSERDRIKFKQAFLDANRAKISGDVDKAKRLFVVCIDINPNQPASYFELARLLAQSDITAAIANAKQAFDLDKANKWYGNFLANSYRQSGQTKLAIPVYESLVDTHPNDVELKYALANSYVVEREYVKAISVYDNLQNQLGISEELSLRKKDLYLLEGNEKQAVSELVALVEEYPNESKYLGVLAELYSDIGEQNKAINTYEKLQQKDPDNPLVKLSLYEYYLKGGQEEKANTLLLSAFGDRNMDVDIKVQIILSYLQKTRTAEEDQLIENLADSLVKSHPQEAKAYAMQGDVLSELENYPSAQLSFSKSIELDQSKFIVWTQLFFVDLQNNDFQSLAKHTEEALELYPTQPVIYLYNGIANNQLKEYQKAVLSLEQGKGLIIDNEPLELQFLSNLGDAYYHLDKYSQSFLNFDRALQIEPNNTYVLNNYAYFLSLQNKDLVRARQMIEKCIAESPNSASYLDTYAWILYRLKSYPKAKEYIIKAYKNGGKNSAEVVEHYGDILLKLDEVSEAVKQWQEAYQLEPSDALKQKIEQHNNQ